MSNALEDTVLEHSVYLIEKDPSTIRESRKKPKIVVSVSLIQHLQILGTYNIFCEEQKKEIMYVTGYIIVAKRGLARPLITATSQALQHYCNRHSIQIQHNAQLMNEKLQHIFEELGYTLAPKNDKINLKKTYTPQSKLLV